MYRIVPVVALAALAATNAAAQTPRRPFVEILGGGVVPTFDIADVAKSGGAFGATAGVQLSHRWVLMAEVDVGMHKDKATGAADIETRHYIAKVGYSLTGPRDRGWEALINLGVGAVTFDVQGAPNAYTYPAINAGAKVAFHFTPQLAFVLSPQGDIAFAKRSEVATTNAWVWPFTAGFRVRF